MAVYAMKRLAGITAHAQLVYREATASSVSHGFAFMFSVCHNCVLYPTRLVKSTLYLTDVKWSM